MLTCPWAGSAAVCILSSVCPCYSPTVSDTELLRVSRLILSPWGWFSPAGGLLWVRVCVQRPGAEGICLPTVHGWFP